VPSRKQVRRERKRYIHDGPRENASRGEPRREQKPAARRRGGGARGRKPVQPASWPRAIRMTVLFAAVYCVILLTVARPKHATPSSIVVPIAIVALLAVPMSYTVQRIAYRQAEKRGIAAPPK
jgi:hypothetical protein